MSTRRSAAPIVGRDAERARLLELLDAAADGDARTVVISGEAGIGKSRLLAELEAAAVDGGGVVIRGAAPAVGGRDVPFAPFVDAFRTMARRVDRPELERLAGSGRRELGRIAPVLALDDDRPEDAQDEEPAGWARTRLFEAIAALIERAGEWRPPAVVVIEDVQWADQSSHALIAFLVRVLRDARVVLALTVRTDDLVPPGSSLQQLLAELERDRAVLQLRLAPLPEDAIRELVVGLAAGGAGLDVDLIVRRSNGVPFYAEELASAAGREAPGTLPGIVLARLGGVAPDVHALLRVAALAGGRFEHALLVAAGGLAEGLTMEALRNAVARRVLVSATGAWGIGFEFRHELLREALEAELLPDERAAAHGRLAAAIESGVLGVRDDRVDARLARHWLAAGQSGRALTPLVRAARDAEARFAFPEAAAHYRNAIVAWDRLAATEPGSNVAAVAGLGRRELHRRAAEMEALVGETREAIRLITGLLADAAAASDPREIAELQARLGRFLWEADERERAVSTLAEAAALTERMPPGGDRARILASYARVLASMGRADEAVEIASAAVVSVRDLPDAAEAAADAAAAHLALALALARAGRPDEASREVRLARSSAPGGGAAPSPSRILSLVGEYADLAAALDAAGDPSGRDDIARQGASVVRRMGAPAGIDARLDLDRAGRAYRSGAWDESEATTRAVLASPAVPAARRAALVLRARLATGRGRYAEAAEALGVVMGDGGRPGTIEASIAAAELGAWRDRLDDGWRAVSAALGSQAAGEPPALMLELLAIGARIQADRLVLARARRIPAEAAAAEEALVLLTAQAAATGSGVGRRGDETAAWLAQLECERRRAAPDGSRARWSDAGDLWSGLGRPFPAAYALWQAAETGSAGRSGRDEVRAPLQAAWRLASDLGAAPLLARIEATARRARVEPTERPAEPRPAEAAPFGLSGREVEVLVLVADGRTNRQIADQLFITEKTAGHHVSNILGKLGVGTRGEAGAIAHRVGLAGTEAPPAP